MTLPCFPDSVMFPRQCQVSCLHGIWAGNMTLASVKFATYTTLRAYMTDLLCLHGPSMGFMTLEESISKKKIMTSKVGKKIIGGTTTEFNMASFLLPLRAVLSARNVTLRQVRKAMRYLGVRENEDLEDLVLILLVSSGLASIALVANYYALKFQRWKMKRKENRVVNRHKERRKKQNITSERALLSEEDLLDVLTRDFDDKDDHVSIIFNGQIDDENGEGPGLTLSEDEANKVVSKVAPSQRMLMLKILVGAGVITTITNAAIYNKHKVKSIEDEE